MTIEEVPGPPGLGRGAVLRPGSRMPPGLVGAPHYVVDEGVREHPGPLATVLHHHWARREPFVIELAADNDALRQPEVCERPVHELDAGFTFDRERLHALVWANNWDLRSGAPVWWHGVMAQRRLGAIPSDVADVRLPDGTDVWCDGGPRGPLEPLAQPTIHRESIALLSASIAGNPAPADPLAPDQLAAVSHHSGAARVIAPAGSGKTRVLTARLRHLLRDRGIEPELVTAVAYNRRAAEQMRTRLADLRHANVRTIHSLAWWICSLEERRELIEERDVRAILERLVRVGRVPNQDPFQPWLEALGEIRVALRNPAAVEEERGDVDGLAEVYPRFRDELRRRNVLDFDEQVHHAIEVLLTRPDIRATVQQRCTHLLVDEFQDLTPAFVLLLRLAAGPFLQVFGVGDDDQVIYSYAGATPDYLIDFDGLFPAAGEHALTVNYRCPPDVVAAADTLLSHNRRRLPKKILAGRAGKDVDVLTTHVVPTAVLATRTVTIVRERLEAGVAPADVAVLARVNSQLLPVQVALGEAGIPRTCPLDATVVGRTGIRTALAYLQIATQPETIRREHVLDTLNRPSRRVKRAVEPFLKGRGTMRLDALGQIAESLEEPHRERFAGYLEDLRQLVDSTSAGADTATLLRVIRDEIGLGQAMSDLDSSRTRPEGSSHTDDLDALSQLAHLEPDPRRFRAWLVESLRHPGEEDGVVLSTVHRVKGMEWPHVIVFGANDGLFPHRLADDIEEERRIFHVAITRCQETVDLVADAISPSPFLPQLRERAAEQPVVPGARATELLERTPTWTGDDVVAEVGVPVVLAGGIEGIVSAIGGHVEVTTMQGVRVPITWGGAVNVEGRATRLVRRPAVTDSVPIPRVGSGSSSHVLEALKAWRRERARADGVPAYVILHDRHLEVIASRLPATLRELAPCPGIGPTKLERYGDDILEVIEAAS
ncbi:MAG: ATP-dependent DNA helicase UvrD2 [Nitriliruptorales bacterium]|nr:ATP-dependent DNA helicase UvrD2 [Nitriliruptorales bacterium]